jgi:hypothetical protein
VTADPDDPMPGVREHNATFAHHRWRRGCSPSRAAIKSAEIRAQRRADVDAVRARRGV